MDNVTVQLSDILDRLDVILDNDEIPGDLWDLLNSSYHNVETVLDSIDGE